MRFAELGQWLAWQEGLHPVGIDLGLERSARVLQALGYEADAPFPVITVAGTNGKGSTVAFLSAILRAAGYRVGSYTSPHLRRYNERVRIDGEAVTDGALCESFARIDAVRGETTLTYFEFGTLAAIDLFHRAAVDVTVLEVGLGGRLDAVNILNPDVAVISSVGIDHTEWLGPDIASIAREKAGILRPGRPLVYGGEAAREVLAAQAEAHGCPFYAYGRDFRYEIQMPGWTWYGARRRGPLPLPALRGTYQFRNATTAIQALEALAERLPVGLGDIRLGLQEARLEGRFQIVPGEVELILDVSHNPAAVTELAASLRQRTTGGRTWAVLGIAADKDLAGVVDAIKPEIDRWIPVSVANPRCLAGATLAGRLRELGVEGVEAPAASVAEGLLAARQAASPGDRVLLFGSFFTVAEGLVALEGEGLDWC